MVLVSIWYNKFFEMCDYCLYDTNIDWVCLYIN